MCIICSKNYVKISKNIAVKIFLAAISAQSHEKWNPTHIYVYSNDKEVINAKYSSGFLEQNK